MTKRSLPRFALATATLVPLLALATVARSAGAEGSGATAAPDQPGAASAAGASAAGPAAEGAGNAPAPRKEELQEVTVYGMRANLEKSLDVKKLAPVVLDSITSTELGRFPDADVADSLSHLPGITIERTTGGEGQKITVRGLSSEYNIVTLNNRILASDDDG
ncbi:MAG: TonB-dependent receptor plug domain-containing protein, partial [Gammaproteobacteria bacterium]|nr:TonB-dependent receptor plug domain-containing protein [Gammaproteobacteria bacterium]